ncbi:MAG: hypothetical protein SGPRY_004667 [Prymnesium sp.]
MELPARTNAVVTSASLLLLSLLMRLAAQFTRRLHGACLLAAGLLTHAWRLGLLALLLDVLLERVCPSSPLVYSPRLLQATAGGSAAEREQARQAWVAQARRTWASKQEGANFSLSAKIPSRIEAGIGHELERAEAQKRRQLAAMERERMKREEERARREQLEAEERDARGSTPNVGAASHRSGVSGSAQGKGDQVTNSRTWQERMNSATKAQTTGRPDAERPSTFRRERRPEQTAIGLHGSIENANNASKRPLAAKPTRGFTEEEAKQAWLARTEAPTWGRNARDRNGRRTYAGTTVSESSSEREEQSMSVDSVEMPEDEAKRNWLARLKKQWGHKTSDVQAKVESNVVAMGNIGETDSSEVKSSVKDEPTPSTRRSMAEGASSALGSSRQGEREEEAKQEWLARSQVRQAAKARDERIETKSEATGDTDSTTSVPSNEAKREWLAPSGTRRGRNSGDARVESEGDATDIRAERMSEEAKRAWLARAQSPTWRGKGKAARSKGGGGRGLDKAGAKNREEEAKQAWLASLDSTALGETTAARWKRYASGSVSSQASNPPPPPPVEPPSYSPSDMPPRETENVAKETEPPQEVNAEVDSAIADQEGVVAQLQKQLREMQAQRKWLESADVDAVRQRSARLQASSPDRAASQSRESNQPSPSSRAVPADVRRAILNTPKWENGEPQLSRPMPRRPKKPNLGNVNSQAPTENTAKEAAAGWAQNGFQAQQGNRLTPGREEDELLQSEVNASRAIAEAREALAEASAVLAQLREQQKIKGYDNPAHTERKWWEK